MFRSLITLGDGVEVEIVGIFRFLVDARNLQLKCAKVLHDGLPVSVLMH